MNIYSKRFLRRPRPFPDEAISGYLIRLAEENGCLRANLSSILRFKWVNQRNFLYGTADYSRLSRMADVPEAELKALAYMQVKVNSKQLIGVYEVFNQNIFSYSLRYREPGLCPECLVENPYQRKIWDLLSITACPVHKRMLINQCPACERKITYKRNRLCFCDCEYDFREAETEYVPDGELSLVRRIFELCNLEIPEQRAESAEKTLPAVLSNLDLSGLSSALYLVIGQTQKGDILGKNLLRLSIKETHEALNSAMKIYENFPHNFFEFLESLKIVFNHRVNGKDVNRISKKRTTIYHGVIRLITIVLANPQFDFLRDALREFLNREKLTSYKINLDYSKTTAAEFYASHIAQDEVCKRFGTSRHVIRGMIKTGALRAREGVMPNGQSICYIRLCDVESVERRLPDIISTMEIRHLLGIYPHQINYLINAGIIEIIEDIKIAPVFCRVVSKQRMLELYDSFHSAMLKNPAYKRRRKTITATGTAVIFGKLHIDYGQWARMVLNGELAPVGRDPKIEGLNGFIYDEEQVNTLFERRAEQLGEGTLALAEVNRLLQIQPSVFRALMRKNYFTIVDTKTVLRKRIPRESFDHFRSEYVFSNEIAREFSTSPEYVNKRLAAKNIVPVENEMDRHTFLYRRADVEGVAIEKPVYTEYNFNYRENKLHTLEDTARKLELSEQELLLAVEHKLLYPCRRGGKDKMRFSDDNIEAFLKLKLPHVNFRRREDAAEMFGITFNSFEMKYLKTKRIVPEIRYYRKNRISLFYSVEDLNTLKAIEEKCIGSTEAAFLLNTSVASINRLVDKGLLKPISGKKIDGYCNYRFLKSEIEAHSSNPALKAKRGRIAARV